MTAEAPEATSRRLSNHSALLTLLAWIVSALLTSAIFLYLIVESLDREPSSSKTFFVWVSICGLMINAVRVAFSVSKFRSDRAKLRV
jgi:hypothetical protein